MSQFWVTFSNFEFWIFFNNFFPKSPLIQQTFRIWKDSEKRRSQKNSDREFIKTKNCNFKRVLSSKKFFQKENKIICLSFDSFLKFSKTPIHTNSSKLQKAFFAIFRFLKIFFNFQEEFRWKRFAGLFYFWIKLNLYLINVWEKMENDRLRDRFIIGLILKDKTRKNNFSQRLHISFVNHQ